MFNQLTRFAGMIQKPYLPIFIDLGSLGEIPRKWHPLLNHMKVISFEPDPRDAEKITHANVARFNYVLNDTSEDLIFHITKGHGKSSRFMPNKDILLHFKDPERFHVIKDEMVPASRVKTLDLFMEESKTNDADFIKLDTQGSELLILKGGQKKAVPAVFGIQTEVEFIEMYKKQSLFRDVDEFLDSKGFFLIDLRRQYWKRKEYCEYRGKGQLVFADALYFKRVDIFYRDISTGSDEGYAKAKILKGILICLVYRIFDYAVVLAEAGVKQAYLSDDEFLKITSLIKEYAAKGLTARMHLGRIYHICNSILQRFKPPSYMGWSDGDSEIGNIKDE